MKKKSLYPSPGCRKIIHFLVMKASFIFLLLLTLQIKANVYAQQLRLDLNLQNVTLKEVIQESAVILTLVLCIVMPIW